MHIRTYMYNCIYIYVCFFDNCTESEARGERDEDDDVTEEGLYFVRYINARRHWRFSFTGFSYIGFRFRGDDVTKDGPYFVRNVDARRQGSVLDGFSLRGSSLRVWD